MSVGAESEQLVLVGRDRALARLEASTGRTAGVLLTGEAGVGKSHLARYFVQRLESRGQRVHRLAGLPGSAQRPLAALRPVLDAGPTDGQEPTRWAAGQLSGPEAPDVLLLDDVDALDDLSATVLHRVAQAANGPWLILTLRAGRVLPAPVERLVTAGLIEQTPVRTLDDAGSTALAEHLLGGPLVPTAAHELQTRSVGNPLFLRELVAAGHDDDLWVRRAAGWALSGPVTVADRLGPLISVRLSGLDAPTRRLGEALAVLGPLTPDVIAALGMVERVGPLVGAGIASLDNGVVALGHPLFAETLLDHVTPESAITLVRRVLDLSESMELSVATMVQVTSAALDRCGQVDPEHLTLAAQLALSLYDPSSALRLADAAVAQGGGDHARLLAANARAMVGGPDSDRALVELTLHDDTGLRQRAELALARLRVAGPNGADHVLDLLADSRAPGVKSLRAVAHLRAAEWEPAIRSAVAAVESAQDTADWLDAAAICALLQVTGDDVAAGWALARRALDTLAAGAVCAPHVPLVLAQAAALGAMLAGEPARAAVVADRVVSGSGQSQVVSAHRAMRRGYVHFLRGRVHSASRELGRAVPLLGRDDPVDIRAWTLGHLAQAQAMTGDLEAARESVARGHETAAAGQASQLAAVLRGEAWVRALAGDMERARELMRGLLGSWEGTPVRRALVLVDLARFGDLATAAEGLTDAERSTGSVSLAAAERTVSGIAAGDLGAVIDGAERLELAGMQLWVADLLALAVTSGDVEGGEGLRGRVLRASMWCESPVTPALSALDVRITETQQRVAQLAAQGLTNRQIAEQLGMSPRTAATHLHRAYKVLGVNSRDELGPLVS